AGQALHRKLVPHRRTGLRRLGRAGTALGRLSEREGGVIRKHQRPGTPAVASEIIKETAAHRALRRKGTTTSMRPSSSPSGGIGVLPTTTSVSGMSSRSFSPSTKKWWCWDTLVSK